MEKSLDLKEFALDKLAGVKKYREEHPTEKIPGTSYLIPMIGDVCVMPYTDDFNFDPSDQKAAYNMLKHRVLTSVLAKKINAIAAISVYDSKAIKSKEYMLDTYNIDIQLDKDSDRGRKMFIKDFERYKGYNGFPSKYIMYSFIATMMGPGFAPWIANQFYEIVDGKAVFQEVDTSIDTPPAGMFPDWWGVSGAELPNIPDSEIKTYYPESDNLTAFDAKKWAFPSNIMTTSGSIN